MNLSEIKLKEIASNVRDAKLQEQLKNNMQDFEVKDGVGEQGDIILVKVLNDNGAYNRLENLNGRSIRLYKGDYIIGVLGNRFSGINIFGVWQPQKVKGETLNLLTNGGIIGHCTDAPRYMGPALEVEAIGLIYINNEKVNIKKNFGAYAKEKTNHIPLVFVCGTSGETGKTTTTKDIILHLKRNANLRVAGVKISGTGCMEDILEMKDCGSDFIGDLSDVGLASTYCEKEDVIPAIYSLLNQLEEHDIDICVCELGGDVTGGNVMSIFHDQSIMSDVVMTVLTFFDILGIVGVREIFKQQDVDTNLVLVHNIKRNITATDSRLKDLNYGYPIYDFNLGECKDSIAKDILEIINKKKK